MFILSVLYLMRESNNKDYIEEYAEYVKNKKRIHRLRKKYIENGK